MKKLLLVIDIQNEYITPERPFHISGIGPSLANAKQVLDAARKSGTPVWHIQHLQEKNVFVKGTPLSEIVTEFKPFKNEPVFIKDLYSSFSSPDFKKEILKARPEEIIVIGYGSSMCCLCTIIDGVHRGLSFTLVEDATAAKKTATATEEEMHRSAANILGQYAAIKSTEAVIQNLTGKPFA